MTCHLLLLLQRPDLGLELRPHDATRTAAERPGKGE